MRQLRMQQEEAERAGGRPDGRRRAEGGGGRRGRVDRRARRHRHRARAQRCRARATRDDRARGPDPALRRPAGRRQDVGGQVDRPRDGAEVRPHLAGRRPRRGRHPRPPAHLRRRHAGPDHPGDEAGRHQESGVPARRGGQAGRLVPGRPGERAARGARPGPERHVRRPLPRRAVRPERGALHRHGELHPEHPRPAARPDGSGGVRRLHRAGEAGDRPEVSHPAPVHRERGEAASSSRSPTTRWPR